MRRLIWVFVGHTCSMVRILPLRLKSFINLLDSKTHKRIFKFTLILLTSDIPCLCKQCRARSVGFWRRQLIWICTVCHSVFEFISTIYIKKFDWLKIRSLRGILIHSAWQGLSVMMSENNVYPIWCHGASKWKAPLSYMKSTQIDQSPVTFADLHSVIDNTSDCWRRTRKFKSQLGHKPFVEIDHKIISMVILPLPLIFSVTGESICSEFWSTT